MEGETGFVWDIQRMTMRRECCCADRNYDFELLHMVSSLVFGYSALVDFEMWQNWSGCKNRVGDVESEEGQMEDLRRWGLASRPPAKNWWAEFGIETR